MEECDNCEGIGVIECGECSEGSYDFLMGETCHTCSGHLIIRCPECHGRGRVPVDEENNQ